MKKTLTQLHGDYQAAVAMVNDPCLSNGVTTGVLKRRATMAFRALDKAATEQTSTVEEKLALLRTLAASPQ